jgi:hypothetical protein
MLIASVSVSTKQVASIPVFVTGIQAVCVIYTGDGLCVTDYVCISVCVCFTNGVRWRNTLYLTGGVLSLTIWNHDLHVSSRNTTFIYVFGTIWWSTQKLLIKRNTLRVKYTQRLDDLAQVWYHQHNIPELGSVRVVRWKSERECFLLSNTAGSLPPNFSYEERNGSIFRKFLFCSLELVGDVYIPEIRNSYHY